MNTVVYCIYFSQEGCISDIKQLRIGCGGQTGPLSAADSVSTDDARSVIEEPDSAQRNSGICGKSDADVC